MPAITTGTSYGVVVANTDGVLKTIDAATFATDNIYTADGALTSNRILDLNGSYLRFKGIEQGTSWNLDGRITQFSLVPSGKASMGFGAGNNTNLFISAFSSGTTQIKATGNATSLILGTGLTTNPTYIRFDVSQGGIGGSNPAVFINSDGNLGIGLSGLTASEKLDVTEGNVRIRDINTNTGAVTDRVVVADADGVLKTIDATTFATDNIYTADSALTSDRTLDLNGSYLRFDGAEQITTWNSTGAITQTNILPTAGSASMGFLGGNNTKLYIQAFRNGAAQIIASGNTDRFIIGTGYTTDPTYIRFDTSPGGGAAPNPAVYINSDGNLGIGSDGLTASEKLDVTEGNVRIRDINTNTGAVTDRVVVADATGILKTVKAAMPKFFYMPSMVMPTAADQIVPSMHTTESGGTFTVDLYAVYAEQFGGTNSATSFSSTGSSPLPVLPAGELDYHVTFFDNTVFTIVSLSNTGVLTYTIAPGAVTTMGSFMNVVFAVKP